MNISDKILNLRKEQGLSQEQLAEKLGVSRQSVSKWESGGALPDIDKVVAMSALFNVSTDYLLINSEDKDTIEDDNTDTDNSVLDSSQEINEHRNEFDTAPIEITEVESGINFEDVTSYKSRKKSKCKTSIKIISLVLVLALASTCIILPIRFGGIREAWWEINGGKINYPYVLVHGLGGWGDDQGINDKIGSYWGADSGSLTEFLTKKGYEVYAPSVGPVSSTWDRTCELYAQLTGTRVDYGEAHSKEHGHERFGRVYEKPLFEGWGEKQNGGQIKKINLVGHSFGGATVRMLTSLLEYGDSAEQSLTGDNTSPLFLGGKGEWVNSVTTLCAPHNGSALTEVLNRLNVLGIADTTDLLIKLCFSVSGLSEEENSFYDLHLEHFGVKNEVDTSESLKDKIASIVSVGTDHAAFDLSPDGAKEINKKIKTVDKVYYFSYSYQTTQEKTTVFNTVIQEPLSSTLPVLILPAAIMGSYTGTTDGGTQIDKSWQPNDGLVSVVSAQCPDGEISRKYSDSLGEFERGVWYIMPTLTGDHGTVIGLNADAEKTRKFYTDWFNKIDSMERL